MSFAIAGMMVATSLLMNEPMMKATGTIMKPVADAITSKYSPLMWISEGLGWLFGSHSPPPRQPKDVDPKIFIDANHWMLEDPSTDQSWSGKDAYDEEVQDARDWVDQIKRNHSYKDMIQIATDPEHHQLAAELTNYPELFSGDAFGMVNETKANAFNQKEMPFEDHIDPTPEPKADPTPESMPVRHRGFVPIHQGNA